MNRSSDFALELSRDAYAELKRRVKAAKTTLASDFESFVEQLCDVAKELRVSGGYSSINTLPMDTTLRKWYYEARKVS